jgi:hypothetical protein
VRSFADEDTYFALERSDTPVTVDGYKLGEPTGRVSCTECRAVAANVDEIPHERACSQRFVHSRWYGESTVSDCD